MKKIYSLINFFVLTLLALYLADSLIYWARHRPTEQVVVNRVVQVPLKGDRSEFDNQGTLVLTCSKALFPRAGSNPCWWLHRNTEQIERP